MNRTAALLLVGAICVRVPVCLAAPITIDTVLVGNPGNGNDLPSNTYGGVNYVYRMGTYEVTNTQYVAFLNAKAVSDPLGLYTIPSEGGSSNLRTGIARSGVSGNFTYAVKPNMGNKPVNVVSWYDVIRFANWMHNGQGDGDTETGAYTLGALGPGGVPIAGASITRNANANWFLPSESEWYKAAYYQPFELGGDSDSYWTYPTAANSTPVVATAITVGPRRGDIANPGANVANYAKGADWNGPNGNVTTVGSAGPLSASFYGTYDQAGNVYEWNEAVIIGLAGARNRGLRGGSIDTPSVNLATLTRRNSDPSSEHTSIGFRIAAIPEPSSLALAAFGLAGLAAWGWRRWPQT